MDYKKIDNDSFSEILIGGQIKITELEKEVKINNETIAELIKEKAEIDNKYITKIKDILQAHNAQKDALIAILEQRNKNIGEVINKLKQL